MTGIIDRLNNVKAHIHIEGKLYLAMGEAAYDEYCSALAPEQRFVSADMARQGIESLKYVDADAYPTKNLQPDDFRFSNRMLFIEHGPVQDFGFDEDHSVGASREGRSIKRSYRSEGRNFVD